VLFESASGYGLFEVVEAEEIGALLPQVARVRALVCLVPVLREFRANVPL
jgi:hypothetical protein